MEDDLPWPELGNVSRGATRGNQGSKGSIGPVDASGCAILQLRVQPGVLSIKLNRQSTDWYHILEHEVQGALMLTKTHWRKARRRQDYDARADQDHMELHEWLQQLKDKCMSHLELLVQKGDIQGKPYAMPAGIEFAFMRRFIERQAAGIPHNPRLRDLSSDEQQQKRHQSEALTEDVEDSDTMDAHGSIEASEAGLSNRSSQFLFQAGKQNPSRSSASSPSQSEINTDFASMVARIEVTNQALGRARARAAAARKTVNENFVLYNSTVDAANRAEQDVQRIQEQLDNLIDHMVHLMDSPSNSDMPLSMVLPSSELLNGMQPRPLLQAGLPQCPSVTGPGRGLPYARGQYPFPHQHIQALGRGYGPQTPVTPSIAGTLGLPFGPDSSSLPSYYHHQIQHQQIRQAQHGHGMTPHLQHPGYSSPWNDPLVEPPEWSTWSASVGTVLLGLNGISLFQQRQARYEGETREDS